MKSRAGDKGKNRESGEKTKMGRYFDMALAVSFALFYLTDSCMLRVYVCHTG